MKLFQSKAAHMNGRAVSVSLGEGYPNKQYPNGGGYCYHDFIEIEFFASGGGIHHLNGVPYIVEKGYFYLLMPGDYHYYSLDEAVPFKIFNVKLDPDALSCEIKKSLDSYECPLAVYLDKSEYDAVLSEMEYLYSRVSEAQSTGDFVSEALIKNSAERTVLLLMKGMKKAKGNDKPSLPRDIRTVVDYVARHFKRQITADEMGALIGLTPHYFSSYFTRHTGVSFCDYVNRVRLFHAAELLELTELSVKEIASASGFGSQAYFSRLFLRQFKTTPSAYRKSGGVRQCSVKDKSSEENK